MKLKQSMILAAGFGKRMMPITKKIPKPLIKIGNSTLLENCILILREFGIEKIIINTHYLSSKIENYIKNKRFDINIKIIKEENIILDTGGGILNATLGFGEDAFMVLNPDTIWNKEHINEFKSLEKIYFEKKITSLLLVNKNKSFDKNFSGDFNLDNKGLVSRDKSNQMIYTGAQIISREIFENRIIKPFSMNEVWDDLITKKSLQGIESDQEFLHLNNKETYKNLVKKKFTR